MLSSSARLSIPEPIVALPCGSRSTTSTRWPMRARPAARLTVVVVLPTPPFWLAMQKMRVMGSPVSRRKRRASVGGESNAEPEEEHPRQLFQPASHLLVGLDLARHRPGEGAQAEAVNRRDEGDG